MANGKIETKIAVVVWQIPVTEVSIEYDASANSIYPGDILWIDNPYDLCAIEEAIRLREIQKNMTVTVITTGPTRVQSALRNYMAMGADEAIQICGQTDHFDTYSILMAVSEIIKDGEYNLIFCGQETVDNFGCTTYPGPYLAGILGLPQISRATGIDLKDNEIVVKRKIEHGDREILRCSLPCVIAIEKDMNAPRNPSLPDLLGYTRENIQTIDIASLKSLDLASSGDYARNSSFGKPHKRVKKTMSIDTKLSAADRMKMVMSGGLSQKSDRQMLTGNVNKMAQDIIAILKNRGILLQTENKA